MTPETHPLSVLTYTHPIWGRAHAEISVGVWLTSRSHVNQGRTQEIHPHWIMFTHPVQPSLSKHSYYGSISVKAQFRMQKWYFIFPPKHLIMTAIHFIKFTKESNALDEAGSLYRGREWRYESLIPSFPPLIPHQRNPILFFQRASPWWQFLIKFTTKAKCYTQFSRGKNIILSKWLLFVCLLNSGCKWTS